MKIASLFSGAGGLDLGFKMARHEVIWANDLYHDACETYKFNIGDHIVEKDITLINSSDIPDHEILIGGFPCQGFSLANTKRHVGDSRNQLYLEFLRVLRDKQPLFFVAENVKGILSLGKGRIIEMICSDFSSCGYDVKYKLLNSADYGVPQTRERVIIVGVRKDLNFEYVYPEPSHSADGKNGKTKWVSIGQAMAKIPDPDTNHNLENHTYSKFKLKFNGYIGNRHIDPKRPAPTVTARGDDRGGVVVLHHPNNERRMSARELAATQSFPLEYIFSGNRSSIYRQIGNAVPPLLGYAIAKSFPKDIDEVRKAI